MNIQELRQYVETNPALVKVRASSRYPHLSVIKYAKRVFYDGLWNDYLEECRGLVIDRDWNIVSYPFTKVYNYGVEDRAPQLDANTSVSAYRKINGFMVAISVVDGELLVSTTGSLDSPFVDLTRETIGDRWDAYRTVLSEYTAHTFMFECVHPQDPHIVPETAGMYLLGMRGRFLHSTVVHGGLNDIAQRLGCMVPERIDTTVGVLTELVKTVRHEGFVFYTADGVCSKIKSPHYLVSKFVARNPRTDKLLRPNIKQSLDEEYYPLIDAIQADIVAFTALDEQARLAWVRNFMSGAHV